MLKKICIVLLSCVFISIPGISTKSQPAFDDQTEFQYLGNSYIPHQTLQDTTDSVLAIPVTRYQDNAGGIYEYDSQNRLLSYKAKKNTEGKVMASTTMKAAPMSFSDFLSKQIENFSEFCLISESPTEWNGKYLYYERIVGTSLKDTAVVSVTEDGQLSWFVVNYCNLTSLSPAEKHYFQQKLEEYLASKTYVSYKTDVTYQKVEQTIIANYSIIYTDENGANYAEAIAFSMR